MKMPYQVLAYDMPDQGDTVIICPSCGQIMDGVRWYNPDRSIVALCQCGQEVRVFGDEHFEAQEEGQR